jgi:hypothetical protein
MPARRFHFSRLFLRRRHWLALVVIALVLLAHLALIEWVSDSLALIRALDDEDDTVIVELHTPEHRAAPAPTIRPTPPPAAEYVAPKVPAELAAPPTTPPPVDAAATETAASPANAASATAPTVMPTVMPADLNTADPKAAESSVNNTNVPHGVDSAPPLFERVSFPPSAELGYEALATQGSRRLSGSGSIVWQFNGQSYLIKGEASALLLNLLSYQSAGQIGSTGMLPDLYQEKRIGKSATSTHFVRERKTISFSASTQLHEIRGGEQDRGSIIWQLAGLARGDPDKLSPGLRFEAIVAGSKAADRWNVLLIGKENVTIAEGTVSAWHLSLAPAENSFDYQIDLWLSPDRDWYPVKIIYSNRSGASLTMSLSKLNRK